MTQEALKLALEALEVSTDWDVTATGKQLKSMQAITALRKALTQPEQEPVAVYGYCPECGAKGVMRERRPNGNDKCANGHTYPSSKSTPPQPEQLHASEDVSIGVDVTEDGAHVTALRSYRNGAKVVFYSQFHSAPQRTWVGLTDDEMEATFIECGGKWNGDFWKIEDADFHPFLRTIEALVHEAKLKELNT